MTDPSQLPMLFFSDTRGPDGRYPVLDAQQRPVAFIDSASSNKSFTATAGNGAPLCSGQGHGLFSPSFEIVDAGGAPIATLSSKLSSNAKTVQLAGGPELEIPRTVLTRGWNLTDGNGQMLIAAEPEGSAMGRHGAAYVVHHDPQLGLAQVVGVVAAYRLTIKSRGGTASN